MGLDDWFPDSHFTHLVHGSLGGEQQQLSVFALEGAPFDSVKRYAWGRSYLPKSRDEYTKLLGIDAPDGSDVAGLVDNLVKEYNSIHSKSNYFRDTIYKAVIDFAGRLKNYATKAGGTDASSYYSLILGSISAYTEAKAKKNTKAMEEAKESIQEACASLINRAAELQEASSGLRTQLEDFRTDTFQHMGSLDALLEDARRKLNESDASRLETIIKELQLASLGQRFEFTNDALAADKAPQWALVPLFGLLPLKTIAEYGPRMAAVRSVIEATENETKLNNQKFKSVLRVATDNQQSSLEAAAVAPQLRETVTLLDGVEAAWKRIGSNLKDLHDAVGKGNVPSSSYNKKDITQVVGSWNELGKMIAAFEKEAFDDFQYMSLKDWLIKTASDGKVN